jgi:hypothetical protein
MYRKSFDKIQRNITACVKIFDVFLEGFFLVVKRPAADATDAPQP